MKFDRGPFIAMVRIPRAQAADFMLLPQVGEQLVRPQEPGGSVIIISAPNENSQKASKSVNVLAAGSQDEICVNEHQN